MLMTPSVVIEPATPTEDRLIAEHFRQMWLDLDIPPQGIAPDWVNITQQFIEHARDHLSFQAFVARVGDRVVGSASGQRFAGLYPNILTAEHRQYGYIWGVYVESAFRKRGIATQLTRHVVDHLKAIGCTHAVLNASPMGQPIYEKLGFEISNTMRLELLS